MAALPLRPTVLEEGCCAAKSQCVEAYFEAVSKRDGSLMKRGLWCWNPDREALTTSAIVTGVEMGHKASNEYDVEDGHDRARMSWPTRFIRHMYKTVEAVNQSHTLRHTGREGGYGDPTSYVK